MQDSRPESPQQQPFSCWPTKQPLAHPDAPQPYRKSHAEVCESQRTKVNGTAAGTLVSRPLQSSFELQLTVRLGKNAGFRSSGDLCVHSGCEHRNHPAGHEDTGSFIYWALSLLRERRRLQHMLRNGSGRTRSKPCCVVQVRSMACNSREGANHL